LLIRYCYRFCGYLHVANKGLGATAVVRHTHGVGGHFRDNLWTATRKYVHRSLPRPDRSCCLCTPGPTLAHSTATTSSDPFIQRYERVFFGPRGCTGSDQRRCYQHPIASATQMDCRYISRITISAILNDTLKFLALGMSVLLSWNGERACYYLRSRGATLH